MKIGKLHMRLPRLVTWGILLKAIDEVKTKELKHIEKGLNEFKSHIVYTLV